MFTQPTKKCFSCHETVRLSTAFTRNWYWLHCHILQWKGHWSGWTVKLAECFLPTRHQRWVWNTNICYQWPPWQNGKYHISGLLTYRYLARP